jgi:hypothetical protein
MMRMLLSFWNREYIFHMGVSSPFRGQKGRGQNILFAHAIFLTAFVLFLKLFYYDMFIIQEGIYSDNSG